MLAVVPNTSATPAVADRAKQVGLDLASLESAIDRALGDAARLTQTMLDARRASGVPVHTGQVALMRLQRAQAQLVSASSDVFRVHDEMARIGQELGMLDDPTSTSGLLSDEDMVMAAA